MKCIQCKADNNLRDRTANQGRCKICKRPFAFEPTTMEAELQFTDGFFAKVLADISANDTLYFTRKQLLYLLEKRLSRKVRWAGPRLVVNLIMSVSGVIFFSRAYGGFPLVCLL